MAAITMQRIRPFAGVTTTFPCRTRIVTRAQLITKRKCTSNDKIDKAWAASFGEKLSMAIPLSLGALAVAAPRAMSEDLATMPTSSPAATDDALLLALSTPSGSIEELIVPLLFGVVALLLTVVTGGAVDFGAVQVGFLGGSLPTGSSPQAHHVAQQQGGAGARSPSAAADTA
ncbi:hypothetical protein Agub_g15024, partial [Astrephomene gubernaculifera]